jgi:hypothetical protein
MQIASDPSYRHAPCGPNNSFPGRGIAESDRWTYPKGTKTKNPDSGRIRVKHCVQGGLDFFPVPEVLYISGFQNLLTPFNRRFGKLLPFAQLAHRSRSVEFSLKALEGAIDILSFLNWYN